MAAGEPQPRGVVLDCDVADGIPEIGPVAPGAEALVLVRLFTEPIGTVNPSLPTGRLAAHELSKLIARELESPLRARIEASGLAWRCPLPSDGLVPASTPAFLATRERVLSDGPEITVAISTRDRPDSLVKTLGSLTGQVYPRLRILVVDNAPSDAATRKLVSALGRVQPIDYALEPRPGLSWARNRGIEASDSEVIAFLDDDELCDPWWVAELARGFVEVPEADAVSGLIFPRELETESQIWFERYSGVRRGRGFARAVLSPATAREQSPLYPLPPFGSGGNMAFRREAIESIGRFDTALGLGTPALAGEDTAALSALLLAGGTVVYQPTALVYHRHHRSYQALRRVLLGYGRGLGAYYTSMLLRRPGCAGELVRLSGHALREQLSRRRGGSSALGEDFPRELLHVNRLGLLQGPVMYAGARLHARRVARGTVRR